MRIANELQTNRKFRKILKRNKINWRTFLKYSFLGSLDLESNRQAVCMGKWEGSYDYLICHIETSNGEFGLTGVFEKE